MEFRCCVYLIRKYGPAPAWAYEITSARSTSAPALLAQAKNKIDHARRSYFSDLNDLLCILCKFKIHSKSHSLIPEGGGGNNINANGNETLILKLDDMS